VKVARNIAGERAVVVVLALLWMASVVRVVGAAERHEVFGLEATLAFLCLLLLPYALGVALVKAARVRTEERLESRKLRLVYSAPPEARASPPEAPPSPMPNNPGPDAPGDGWRAAAGATRAAGAAWGADRGFRKKK
jgi:hypothetical protein